MTALQQLIQLIGSLDDSYELDSITNYTIAVQTMDEIYGEQAKSFASIIDSLIAMVEMMLNEMGNIQVVEKTMMFDFIMTVIQDYPRLVKKKSNRVTKLYRIALDMMMQTVQEVDNDWLNPPNGFNADDTVGDDENSNGKAVMSKVDQLSEIIGIRESILNLQPLFLEYIQNEPNWKCQYSALMVASQIAVGDVSVQNLGLFVQWGFKATEHSHPKVRYAALHLLGQFSDDLKPEFQELYYDSFIKFTTKLLVDPVPRVVAHTFACATNFFEDCKDLWKIQNCLGHYLNPIVNSIKTGNSWQKQNATSILSSFAMTEDAFGPNLPNIFDLAFEIIENLEGQEDFKQVINQAFELLTMLLVYQKRHLVQKYVKQTVGVLFAQKDNISKEYFLQSWNRLCLEYEDLIDLGVGFPILLEAADHMSLSHSDDECAAGWKSIAATFACYKVKAAPFAEQTVKRAMEIFQSKDNSLKLREQAINLMQTVITATKPNSPDALPGWYVSAELLFNYLCNKIEPILNANSESDFHGDDVEELPCLFPALKELIESISSLLTGPHLMAVAQKVINYAQIMERHYDTSSLIKQQQKDEEDEVESDQIAFQVADSNIDDLQNAIDVIPDILKDLICAATDPTTKMQIVEIVQKEIERAIGKNNFMILYALNMSVSMMESLSYEDMAHAWTKLTEVYLHFTEHGNSRIRNGGVYGLNLLLQKTPAGIFSKEQVTLLLQKLSNAFTKPYDNVCDKFYMNHSKDNVVSALGILLKKYSANYPDVLNQEVFGYWFSNLPLNTDKTEGNNQQEFLMELLASNPGMVVKEIKDLKHVCQIYAKFVMKRKDRQYREIVQKTRQSLMLIKEWTLFKQSTDYLWSSLSHSHRSALTQLING